jgi:hypothetical protein
MLEWMRAALSNKGEPSTKRLGHLLGLVSACSVVLVVLGVLIGLSLNVPTLRYFDVYSALLDSLYIIIGMMITGGVVGYIGKKEDANVHQ